MTLKSFNVFGRGRITGNSVNIAYNAFNQKGKGTPITISSEEPVKEIKNGGAGEFLFGMAVNPDDYQTYYYETTSIPDIELETLPVVKKYMDLIADSIRKFEQLSS